ncbi:uncharacterized protein LOC107865274 [Capsicum annuum]|uniref:uncharacterized protein LOC107865274 n=1 Tax=Capsicum annuum TaxID=4072 RepID=UPI0007BF4297|nr:uncharacterized protein LOC107865274 [Capsicum annuum]
MAKLSNLFINIPLLEAIQDILGYAKLMKKLVLKKKLIEGDTIEVNHGCSAIMSSKIAEKKEDPRAFIIPCTIRMHIFVKALCDLGAGINLMPFAIYKKIRLDTPTPTSMRLLMANRSIKRPVEILFDVLVKVEKFIFSMDFVVLDYEIDQEVPIILGRPFLATGRAIVDLELGEMRFRVHDDEVSFRVCKIKKQPWNFK